jgi:hypothetical protein
VKRWKLCLFGVLALLGVGGLARYAFAVAPQAPTSFDRALLYLTAIAAATGLLGLIVSLLSYLLEAGRVPKPGLAFLSEGKMLDRLTVEIDLTAPALDVSEELAIERERQEAAIKAADAQRQASTLQFFSGNIDITQREMTNYQEVDKYLKKFEEYLKNKRLIEAFWARSRTVVLAFTNARAGVPAEGIRVEIHIPTDDDLEVRELSEIPEVGDPPKPPTPPRRMSLQEQFLSRATMPDLTSLGRSNTLKPPGNVSPPTFRPGSAVVEYTVDEILHNTQDDTRDNPIVLTFRRPGTWTASYMIHARNLPEPKSGKLTLFARERGSEAD